ncbi:MAG: hypothetical protein EBZ48_07815 [Proteobacteria bacterium]|nr:hypothetical protein [Pseudomonadota bacterium]
MAALINPPQQAPARLKLYAAVLLLGLLAVFRLGALSGISTGFLGGVSGDAGLYVWLFRSHVRGIFTTPWFETSGFYPYGQTLAWSDNFILPGLFGQLGVSLGLTEVLTYNLIILGSTFLTGFCTFTLAFRLTQRFVPSLCAGMSFMTAPYIAGMQGHPQLVFTCFIPLGVHQLLHFISTHSFRSALYFGLVLTAAFATTVYYAIFLVMTAIILYIGLMLCAPGVLPMRAHLRLLLGAIVGVLPLVFLVPPYLAIAGVFGERNLYEAFYFSTSALSFLSAPPDNLIYGASSILTHDEAHLFPGIILLLAPLAALLFLSGIQELRRPAYSAAALCAATMTFSVLAVLLQGTVIIYLRYAAALLSWATIATSAVLLVRIGRGRSATENPILEWRSSAGVFLFLAVITFFVALGPLGNPEHGQLALGVHRLWYEILPGFDSIRAVSRVGVVTIFALSITLALVLTRCERLIRPPLLLLIPTLLAVEHYHTLTPLEPYPQTSEVYQRLAGENSNRSNDSPASDATPIVIALPFTARLNEKKQPASFGEFARRNMEYLLKLFPSGLTSVNGYSGQRSKIMRDFPRKLLGFPDERSLTAACSLAGVRRLIYSSNAVANFNPTLFMQRAQQFEDRLQLIESDSSGTYLFALSCLTKLAKPQEFLVPGSLPGTLRGRASAQSSSGEQAATIQVTLIRGDSEIPLPQIELRSDGGWQEFAVALPAGTDPVRPQRLRFSAAPPEGVAIQELSYQATSQPPWLFRQLFSGR